MFYTLMSVGRKKLSVCQNNVAAFSCCCKVLQYQQTIYETETANLDNMVENKSKIQIVEICGVL